MVLVIDNYDSFTYNLVQYLGELGADPFVRRNDALEIDEIQNLAPQYIVISPGPGRPEHAGIAVNVVREFAARIPILGVCLGHQVIGLAFGASIVSAPSLEHGKCSTVTHDGRGVFSGIDGKFTAGRYHSLAVAEVPWPEELEIAAKSIEDNTIMGIRHKKFQVHGVQFHPESVLTSKGKKIISSFLDCRL